MVLTKTSKNIKQTKLQKKKNKFSKQIKKHNKEKMSKKIGHSKRKIVLFRHRVKVYCTSSNH